MQAHVSDAPSLSSSSFAAIASDEKLNEKLGTRLNSDYTASNLEYRPAKLVLSLKLPSIRRTIANPSAVTRREDTKRVSGGSHSSCTNQYKLTKRHTLQ